jgi:hypothetical protein
VPQSNATGASSSAYGALSKASHQAARPYGVSSTAGGERGSAFGMEFLDKLAEPTRQNAAGTAVRKQVAKPSLPSQSEFPS